MHAKPFKSITPPMGDTFIVVDVSVRRRFRFTKARAQRRENKRYLPSVGFTLPRRHFQEVGQRRECVLRRTRFENSLG